MFAMIAVVSLVALIATGSVGALLWLALSLPLAVSEAADAMLVIRDGDTIEVRRLLREPVRLDARRCSLDYRIRGAFRGFLVDINLTDGRQEFTVATLTGGFRTDARVAATIARLEAALSPGA